MNSKLAIANLERIVRSVDLPVSIDLEAGYGSRPEDVERSVSCAVRAGAVGINLEDGIAEGTGIYGIDDQVARIRAAAYADAGASGLFVPGIVRAEQIRDLCSASTLPVNVMMMDTLPPPAELAQLGVARISHGPGPYRAAMRFIEQVAREAIQGA